jgi:quercetin dioxygenase-like cupin family protein
MNTPQPFFVTPKDYPRPLNVVGEKITVLASGAATGGYEIFLQQGPEGSGPPPHSHAWAETFYVLKGEVEFGYGDERFVATAGALVHMPGALTHWFRARKGGCEMVVVTARSGASKLFADIDQEISPAAPSMEKLLELATRHEVTVNA